MVSGLHDHTKRSTFGLPRLLQELFRIGLNVANVDMCSSHFVSVVELLETWGLDPCGFPDVRAVALDREKYLSGFSADLPEHDRDALKILLISIAYQCAVDSSWPQPLKDLHAQLECIINMHTKRCPGEVATARSWGKKRPHITAFSYKLCHLERLSLDRMIHAAAGTSMCAEFDGLVVFSSVDEAHLDEAVRRVQASTSRVLKVKPYARTWEEWIAKVSARYPREDWTVKSKFPWKDIVLAERAIQEWLEPAPPPEGEPARRPCQPETDIAKVVASVSWLYLWVLYVFYSFYVFLC
jgi:hypothetical protein